MVLDGLDSTRWSPLEVVIVDNGSTDPSALALLDRTAHRVERAPIPFNFPRLCNRGAAAASGDVLVFLNNDMELRDPDWVEALVDQVVAEDVGPVGALLRYPDGTIQHCGMAIGPDGPVHPLRGIAMDRAPAGLALVPGERSAVTGACMAIRSEVFWRLGGFEPLLVQDYNDVDLCLRAWRAGYRVVYTPFTDLVHHESATRGSAVSPDTVADWLLMRSRWVDVFAMRDRWWPTGVAMATGRPQPI
jgi:GT2 family glycosyltransferase